MICGEGGDSDLVGGFMLIENAAKEGSRSAKDYIDAVKDLAAHSKRARDEYGFP